MTRYAVIVDPISTGREYPLAFREAGCRPVAVLSMPAVAEQPTWHAERFDRVHRFDGDLEGLAAQVRAYEPEYLVPGAESGVELTDALVEIVAPGSGNRRELTAARRDKWAMARALARAGVPHLRQLCTGDREQVAAWLHETGLDSAPLVLKPPRSGGADHVHLVPAGADWRPAFDAILGMENLFIEINETVLVSEFAEGTELLVDTYSVDGRHGLVNVCRYTKRQFEDRIGIYDCVEFLAPDDRAVQAVWPYTRQVLDAVGIRNGPSHTEVMLTPSGPRLIEIGARPAGGEHQLCSELATGDNQIKRTVAHRERGEFKPGYELVRQLRLVVVSAPRAGVWHNAEIFDGVESLSSYYAKHVSYHTGDRVPATRDIVSYLAWFILTSDDPDTVEADHRQIKSWEALLDIRPVHQRVY
jgi:biotin carboxylase